MSIVSLAAALLLMQEPAQTPPAPPQVPAVALEDVIVEARRLEELTRDFVAEVSAPPRNRGLARWYGGVCVAVANIPPTSPSRWSTGFQRSRWNTACDPAIPAAGPMSS